LPKRRDTGILQPLLQPARPVKELRRPRDVSRLLSEHPAPNVEPGDVVVLPDGREALVIARVETDSGQIAALLEVAIAPTPPTSDESISKMLTT
jgi:hypothetical protein